MFLLIAILCLLMHLHQTGGGFLRFNNPDHITAPLDLEDLKPGSYDDLLKYNPSLAAPYEAISYGGDPMKPFDWSAPEIEAQKVELVTEPKELPATKEDIIPERLSLPFLVQSSDSANKSLNILQNLNDGQAYNNPTMNNNTDKREVRSSAIVIKPAAKRRANSYTTLVSYDSAVFRKKPKHREYNITTPEHELTKYGYDFLADTYADHNYILEGELISSCYRCGELNYGKWWRPSVERREREGKIIPKNTLCSDAFGDNWEYKTKARYLRSRCYNNTSQNYNYTIGFDNYNFYHECVYPLEYSLGRNHTVDLGNPVECFARYTGRCFKRFLDVGQEYTERGCASWPPHQSNSFASHRFTKMEYLLYNKDNACVSSPIASMTPFARGVSLYVRYHVCVCKGTYCNAASAVAAAPLFLLFTTYIIIKFNL